jgi:hypothetical protein
MFGDPVVTEGKFRAAKSRLSRGAARGIRHRALGRWQLMPNSQRKPQMPVFRYALSDVPGLCTLGKVRAADHASTVVEVPAEHNWKR